MTPAHLLLALLVLQAACNMSALVKPYEPLPGTVTGYIVVVKAPPGAEVLLVPAPNAPPIPLRLSGREGVCSLYVSQPLSIAPGASAIVVLGQTHVKLPLSIPETRGGDIATVKPAPFTSQGDVLGIINSSLRHGILREPSAGRQSASKHWSENASGASPGTAEAVASPPRGVNEGEFSTQGGAEHGFLFIGLALVILLGGLVLRLLYARGLRRASEAEGL